MFFSGRTAVLRLTTMIALVVSAILTADHMHPERAFCPLAEACAAAAGSVLGSFYGVPTSVLGMGAFGLLFLVTLLPVEWSRPLLIPAGLIAAIAGIGFVAYQYYFLESFCPLCLVADGAGFLAGMITLTWPRPPIMRDGSRLPGERATTALRWTFAAALVTAAPFVWPRTEEPGWIEVTPLSESAFSDEIDPETDPKPVAAPTRPAPSPTANPTGVVVLSMAPRPEDPPPSDTGGLAALATPAGTSDPAPGAVEPTGGPGMAPAPTGSETAPAHKPKARAAPEPKRKAESGPLMVEYLNAYCPHCRKTHKRLEQVLAANKSPVRKRRVYTWAKGDYPLWARACAYAESVGREDEMFAELLKTRSQRKHDVYAAARRAGLDMAAFDQAVTTRQPPKRLVRDKRLVQRAKIRMLPTLDIGRRRLQGEQSANELREALRVAIRDYKARSATSP